MTDTIATPANNQNFEQNEVQLAEQEINDAFETNQEVENEYFVLGYN